MMVSRGDIYWVDFGEAVNHEPAGQRPFLVIQVDEFNQTAIGTVIGASITSQTRYSEYPGTVLVPRNESGLPKDSVVKLTEISTVDKTVLYDYAGKLSEEYMLKVLDEFRKVIGL